MSTHLALLLACGALCLAFALIYLLARRMNNYGIVDIAWSYAFAATAAFYALALPGWPVRRWLIGAMVAVWSLRLGTHLFRRVMSHHPEEDTRYQQLRKDWAGNFTGKMFGFFQLQALSVVLLAIPFLLVARNGEPWLHPLEMTGLALWILALAGEALSDKQLQDFKRNPANRGKVCAAGLWRYSRHPNYFFEWLIWVSFSLFALPSPWGGLSVLSPVIILYLLLRVTGIPLAEEQSLRSKGEAYRTYQKRTSAFVPLPPKPSTLASP